MRAKVHVLMALLAILILSLLIAIKTPFKRIPGEDVQKSAPPLEKPNPDEVSVRREESIPEQSSRAAGAPSGDFPRRTYSLLKERHRAARKQLAEVHERKRIGFGWDHAYGYVQARLLAMSYPKEIEELVLATLKDSQSSVDDLVLCAKILGTLASKGSSTAESGLLALLETSNNRELVGVALKSLMMCDLQGKHRAIYWTKCAQDQYDAFEYGPYWVDEQTKQTLIQIKERVENQTTRHYYCREALARLAILESPDCAPMLDRLISDTWDPNERPEKASARQGWALRVVLSTPTKRTVEILRQRLDRDEGVASGVDIGGGHSAPSTHPGYSHAAGDDYYDDALLTYVGLGGRPNETETLRLRRYGYLGDPRERLDALLAEDVAPPK